jgi:hypothetical protein
MLFVERMLLLSRGGHGLVHVPLLEATLFVEMLLLLLLLLLSHGFVCIRLLEETLSLMLMLIERL